MTYSINFRVKININLVHRLFKFDGTSTLLQVLDLSSVQLVYSSSYFKSLSTGGNVSKALVRILLLIVLRLSNHSALRLRTHYAGEI